MQLNLIGLNHQTAPVSARERLAFPQALLGDALVGLQSAAGVAEAMILSTCNRTEIYARCDSPETLSRWLSQSKGMAEREIEPYLYEKSGADAVRHMFRVSCGLDSMVLGEPQILGQLKDAVRAALEAGTMGAELNMLTQRTFAVAKQVRSNTSVGNHSVSMAAASVKMAERIFPDISSLNVLFVGAGEMIELVAVYFAAKGPRRITVANRTLERAGELCSSLGRGASPVRLADLADVIADHDVVVSSTASQLPLVGKGMIETALKKRRNRPMFLLDLAVPRDIEPQVADLRDVYLYTVDDIGEIVQEGMESRKAAARDAEKLVEQSLSEYLDWQNARATVPLIVSLRAQADEGRELVLARAKKLLAKGVPAEEALERLSVQLTNKLMHEPTKALNVGAKERRDDLLKAVADIWRLDGRPAGGPAGFGRRKSDGAKRR